METYKRYYLLILILMGMLSSPAARGQFGQNYTISGYTRTSSYAAIAGVRIYVPEYNKTAYTNSSGYYSITIYNAMGIFSIEASHSCYNFSPSSHVFTGGSTYSFTGSLKSNSLSFSAHPASQSVCPNSSVSLSVSASSATGYTWQRSTDGGASYANIGGASSSYSFTASTSGYKYRCIVYDNCGNSLTSNAATISLYQPTAAGSIACSSSSYCSGESISLWLSGASGTNISYAWYKKASGTYDWGSPISYASSIAVAAYNGDQYMCTISGTCGAASTGAYTASPFISTLNVSTIPSQTVCSDQSIILGASASQSGNGSFTYQWDENKGSGWVSSIEPGSASASMSVNNKYNTAQYRCKVTGRCATTYTNTATTYVNYPGSISSHPASQSLCYGQQASLSITASNASSYTWQRSIGGGAYSNVATGTSYSFAATSAANYQCVITDNCGRQLTSNVASISLKTATSVGSILCNASNYCQGSSINLSLTSASGQNISYAWYKKVYSGVDWGSPISYSSSVSVQAYNGDEYKCVVTGECSAAETNVFTASPYQSPITVSPVASQTVCSDEGIVLSTTANQSSNGSFTYQWDENKGAGWLASSESGSTSPSITVNSKYNTAKYRCKVTGLCATTYTNEATTYVNNPGSIISQPVSQSLCYGQQASLSITASNASSYTWQRSIGGGAYSNVATGTSYSFAATTAANYQCVITDNCGRQLTSNVASITLKTATSVGSILCNASNYCQGSNINLSLTSATGDNISYAWYRKVYNGLEWGSPISTSASVSIVAYNGDQYKCIVTGSCGTAETSEFTAITYSAGITLNSLNNQTICSGGTVSFTVSPVQQGNSSFSYQWYENIGIDWQLKEGATNSGLSANPTVSILYKCLVSGLCTSAYTNATQVIVNNPGSIQQQPQSISICPGSSTQLSVQAQNINSYAWKSSTDNYTSTIGTINTIEIIPLASGISYKCVMQGGCSETLETSIATVSLKTATQAIGIAHTNDYCYTPSITLTANAQGENLSYQWYKKIPGGSFVATGTDSPQYQAEVLKGVQYYYNLTGICGSQESNNIELKKGNINIDIAPKNHYAFNNTVYNLSPVITGNQYQIDWYYLKTIRDYEILAENTSKLSLDIGSVNNGIRIYALMKEGLCEDITDTIEITKMEFTQQPQAALLNYGESHTFAIAISKPENVQLHHQWQVSNATENNFSNILGATDTSLTIILNESTDYKEYRCEITNPAIGYSWFSNKVMLRKFSDYNFIKAIIPRSENYKIDGKYNTCISYLDGLERLVQNVYVGSSPDGNDIIQYFEYDSLNRITKNYLPFTAKDNSGVFRENVVDSIIDFYNEATHPKSITKITTDSKPWGDAVFENSPLNRIIKKGLSGISFKTKIDDSGNTRQFSYGINKAREVIDFRVNANNKIVINDSVYYPAGSLFKISIRDENGVWHAIYKNKKGHVLLKVADIYNLSLKSYYVYDELGEYRYCLTPKAIELMDTTTVYDTSHVIIKDLCYYYEYDNKGRMVIKKLPGAEPGYMIYDKRDRLVLTQDGNLRGNSKWLFTKYDFFNRPIMTGIFNDAEHLSRENMQYFADTDTVLFEILDNNYSGNYKGYSNISFPVLDSNDEILTVNYFDCYNFDVTSVDTFPNIRAYSESFDDNYFPNSLINYQVKGLLTGRLKKVLGTSDNFLKILNLYDDKYRLVRTYNTNYLGGNDLYLFMIDFDGKLLKSSQIHKKIEESIPKCIKQTFLYDHSNRLKQVLHQIDSNGEKLMACNYYNELGQLIRKGVNEINANDFLQNVDFEYDINGWLTHINDPFNMDDDLFAMELVYNEIIPDFLESTDALYNGNVSAVLWKNKTELVDTIQAYKYNYDALNRITKADYQIRTANWIDLANYDMAVNEYDENGNINILSRNGSNGINIDSLFYTYGNTNQLQAVSDIALNKHEGFVDGDSATIEYLYDENGNLILDSNKKIKNIKYNQFNLPTEIDFGGGNKIKYFYDAAGSKLAKETYRKDTLNMNVVYIGNIIYDDVIGDDYTLITSEGMVSKTSSCIVYEYFIKDHLGNIRTVFHEDNGNAIVAQVNNYYPYGMLFKKQNLDVNKHLFNGNELQDDGFDLDGDYINDTYFDWIFYGSRFYDPVLGKFHSIDPMAVFTTGISPYTYADDNPVRFIDYYGLGKKEREERKREHKLKKRRKQLEKDRKRSAFKPKNKGMKYNPNFHHIDAHKPGERWTPPDRPNEDFKPELADVVIEEEDMELEDIELDEIKIEIVEDYDSYNVTGKEDIRGDIRFIEYSYDIYFDLITKKTLDKIVRTLMNDPDVQLIINANAKVGEASLSKGIYQNALLKDGSEVSMIEFLNNRGAAIKKYLKDRGVDVTKVHIGVGNVIKTDKKPGVPVDFRFTKF